jgi:hypothetical protein
MTLNPEKCEFGMSEVKFVGHLIDETGITFSTEKLKQVAEIPIPVTKGELKQFLGLAGYFRNHVPDFASLTHRLNSMLDGYEKKTSKQLLNWTEEQKTDFIECQKAVIQCENYTMKKKAHP